MGVKRYVALCFVGDSSKNTVTSTCLQVAAVAAAHAVLRFLHAIFYFTNAAALRSIAFLLGFICNFVLFGFAFSGTD